MPALTLRDLVGAISHRGEGLVRGQVGQAPGPGQTGRGDALHRFGQDDDSDVVRVALRVPVVRVGPEHTAVHLVAIVIGGREGHTHLLSFATAVGGSEEHGVARPASEVLHLPIGLALIGLEA